MNPNKQGQYPSQQYTNPGYGQAPLQPQQGFQGQMPYYQGSQHPQGKNMTPIYPHQGTNMPPPYPQQGTNMSPPYPQQGTNIPPPYPQQGTNMSPLYPQQTGLYPQQGMPFQVMDQNPLPQQRAQFQNQMDFFQPYGKRCIIGGQLVAEANKLCPTVFPSPNFEAKADADTLRKALKGLGTDEKAIINVLCRRTIDERLKIKDAYQRYHKRNLIDDIQSETSGNFRVLLVNLLKPIEEYFCDDIHESLTSIFKRLDVIIDVLCTMSNDEIKKISDTYQSIHGKSLAQHLKDQTSGHLSNLLVNIAFNKRDESPMINDESANLYAIILKDSINRFFKDEGKVTEIFSSRSHRQIKTIAQKYAALGGNTLQKDIINKFSGEFRDTLLAILNGDSQQKHYAERLHKSMAGLGTSDNALIRLCITRCEIDMLNIKKDFQAMFEDSLKSYIEGDTSGDYMNALLTLCGDK